jgi:polyhydroxyalkanoate synthase subunit PhaC
MTAARAPRPSATFRRLGPRPLPLHLLTAGSTSYSSMLALPLLKSGLLPWKPNLAPHAAALVSDLGATALPDFARAVEAELRRRADALAAGITAYRRHPYRRTLNDAPVIWSQGTTCLRDYRPDGGVPVLIVPSLINRADVLDLKEERSLLRYLAASGLRPLLVDWNEPGEAEQRFDLTAYVAGRLEGAFEAAIGAAGAPMAVLGYCMGGLLALGLALRRQRDVTRLALLATPWDFQSGNPGFARFLGALAEPVAAWFGAQGQVPTDVLQSLFWLGDPHLANRKFRHFAELDPASPEAENFVAVEDWLNDGVPLALPVARECFARWYGANTAFTGSWKLAGQTVDPGGFVKPALVVVPAKDRLVPPVSALALARRLPNAEILQPDLGHIGLVVGGRAPATVWAPLRDWLLCQ